MRQSVFNAIREFRNERPGLKVSTVISMQHYTAGLNASNIFNDAEHYYTIGDFPRANLILKERFEEIPSKYEDADIFICDDFLRYHPFFWKILFYMAETTRSGGYIFISDYSDMQLPHKKNYYEIKPDAFPELARYMHCSIVKNKHNDRTGETFVIMRKK